MNTEAKQVSLDDILDGTLDDLADMPEWKPFPAGAHKVVVAFEADKTDAKAPKIKVKLQALETLELASASDTPLEKGAETVVTWTLNNEFGQGSFKAAMAAFKEHLGMPDGTKNGEIMKAANGMECIVMTTVRDNKDKTAKFTQIKEFAFE